MTNVGVSVLVVDDDPFVRAALRTLIEDSDGVRFAGEAEDGSELAQAVVDCDPDVVLIDLEMPRVDGVTATRRLCAKEGGPAVVVLTNHLADQHVVGALRAGASGYLLKNSPPADIVAAVDAAARGETVLSPNVTQRLVDSFVAQGGRPKSSNTWTVLLTEREQQVAKAIGEGLSNHQIAESLYMSLSTAKSNVSRILAKLNLTNRVQLALLVHELLDPASTRPTYRVPARANPRPGQAPASRP